MWDLWWTDWRWGWFISEYIGISVYSTIATLLSVTALLTL
jgi:hypothetical protein